MNTTIKSKALALLTSLCTLGFVAGGLPAHAASVDPSIKVVIESPTGEHAGVTVVRGFALAHTGIDRVTWKVDDKNMGTLPFGGSRGDVADAYKAYPKQYAESSGFATAWSMSLFDEGEHTIVVTAYDNAGGMNSDSATFTSHRFGADAERFLLQEEMVMQAFVMSGVKLYPGDDTAPQYDIQFNWSKAAQAFVMTKVSKICTGCVTRVTADPGGLQAKYSQTFQSNTLDWTPNSASHVGYEIQRRYVEGSQGQVANVGGWKTIGYRPAYDASFVDWGLSPLMPAGDYVEYRVRAFSEQDVSGWTGAASVSRGNGGVILPGGGGGNNNPPAPPLPVPGPAPAPNGGGLPDPLGPIVNPTLGPDSPVNPVP